MMKINKGAIKITLAAVFWSTQGWLLKAVPWHAFSLMGCRAITTALLLGLVRKDFRFNNSPRVWIGSIAVALTSMLFMLANKLTTAANAVVLQYAMPLFVVLIMWVVKKQKPGWFTLATIFLIIAGVALCFANSFGTGRFLGDLFALLSAGTYAIMFFMSQGTDTDSLQFIYQGVSLCSIGLLYIPFDKDFRISIPIMLYFAAAVFVLFMGYWMFSLGMHDGVSSISAAVLSSIEPVLNPIIAFLIGGEAPGKLAVIGMIIVILTATVYNCFDRNTQTE